MRIAWSRFLLIGLFVIVLVGALAIVFGPSPVDVELERVTRGNLQVTVDSEGKTRVKQLYEISSPMKGRLLRVPFKAGEEVTKGQVVATLEPTAPDFLTTRAFSEAQARVQVAEASRALAEADIKRCEAELEYAETELQRIEALKKTGANTQHELDEAQKNIRTKQAGLEVAKKKLLENEHELALAKAGLIQPASLQDASHSRNVEVYSPIDGRVLKVDQESETIVNPGQVIMSIGDPRTLEIELEMLSEDAAKVDVGAETLIEAWGGPTLKGHVYRVEPNGYTKVSSLGIEEQRALVLVDFEEPQEAWERLGHGYGLDARVVVWESPKVLKVPMGALFRKKNRWAAYVFRDGEAFLTNVEIGHTTTYYAEVLSGLKKGDLVILYPSDRVMEGGFVRPGPEWRR